MPTTQPLQGKILPAGGFVSLALAIFLAALGTSIANVALPQLQTAFEATFQQVQWIVLSYLLSITVVIAAAGKLADIYGSKKLFLGGVALFGIGSIACGLSTDLLYLVTARCVQGVGAAIMMALSMALITTSVDKDSAGKAIAFLGTMSAIGTAAGPVIGGLLLSIGYWPSIFFLSVPIAVVTYFLASKYLQKDPVKANNSATFDLMGAIVLAVSLASYSVAMTVNRSHWGVLNVSLICFSLATLYLFIHIQRKSKSPLIRISLFSQPEMRIGFFLSAVVMMIMMTTLVVGPFYLSYALNLSPAILGMVMAIGPVTVAISGPFAGYFVDKLGVQTTTFAGLCLVVCGSTLLALLPATTGIIGYSLSIVCVTVGYSFFQNSNSTSVMTSAAPHERGLVSALLHLSRNLGLVSGASVMGAIFIYASGSDDMKSVAPEQIANAMQTTFAVAAAVMLMTMAFTWTQRVKSMSEKA